MLPAASDIDQRSCLSPSVVVLQADPDNLLGTAFLWCGWRVLPSSGRPCPTADLGDTGWFDTAAANISSADLLFVSRDQVARPRAGEVPEFFDDGRAFQRPLADSQAVGRDPTAQLPGGTPGMATDSPRDAAIAFLQQQVQQVRERGGGCVVKEALVAANSRLPTLTANALSEAWHDTPYSLCVFAGARCQSQRLRRNIDELASGPPLLCQHFHDPSEWDPSWVDDEPWSPCHEEAQITAPLAFFIAVSASWWAARHGLAVVQVHRLPPVEITGRREHWLRIAPESLRSAAMAPLAISLGMRPGQLPAADHVPVKALAEDRVVEKGLLPAGCVYVGQGNYQHRIPTSKWRNPWVAGLTCDPGQALARYANFVAAELWHDLAELIGKTLLSDTPMEVPCEADVLAGLLFFRLSEGGPLPHPKAAGLWLPNTARIREAWATSRSVGQAVPVPFQQEAVVLRFRKLFPADWFRGFRFPMVEDLLNQAPFDSFGRWLAARGDEWEGPLVPVAAERQQRFRQRTTDGLQVGASTHRAALPPLLPFGLSVDEHFEQSLHLGTQPLPTELHPVLDADLLFAAEMNAKHRGALRPMRQHAVGALKELKRRWGSVGARLRAHQPPLLRQATKQRDLGFTALLIILASWGDVTYAHGLVKGLPAVGFAPPYGVFPIQDAAPVSFEEVLGNWQKHNAETIRRLKPGRLDQVLLEQSLADAAQGFCSEPLSQAGVQRLLRGQPFRVIPRCVITQGSGKHRIIDNAADGGQSATSADSNKLVLCSPLRPAQHLRATISYMSEAELAVARAEDTWQTGGEDWPNAYRHSPMSSEESRACVVCFWHDEWQQPAFQVYAGLLFGLPLAVTSFNRYSRLVEALGRRLVLTMVSLYFDDATVGDWASSKGSGQWAFGQLNMLLGTPFADSKRQPMSHRGDFLRLAHDTSRALSDGVVRFWPRDRIVQKVSSMLADAESSSCLHPGQAAKLYGILNFFEQGVYGKVGAGSLWAIKERQYEATTQLTQDLLDNFRYIRAVIRAQPQRQLPVVPLPCDRFVCASDAAEEPATGGTGGFLIVWLSGTHQTRQGFVADIHPWWYSVWQTAEVHIAQLEISMVAYALLGLPDRFRNRRGIWFLDNVASLMALVKGRSSSRDLENFAHMVHMLLLGLNTQMWFEYIPSKSNWADAISRLGRSDPWHVSQSFSTSVIRFPRVVWGLPPAALLTLASFL